MIFFGNYGYFRLPWVIRMLIFKKENRKSRVKNDFKTRFTEWCNFIKYKKCTPTFQAVGYKRMMQPPKLSFRANGHKKSRYSSPVDHRSLDNLCTNTYTMSQRLCARCTLGVRYLYFKRNAENFGVRVIGRKIRYLSTKCIFNDKVSGKVKWHDVCVWEYKILMSQLKTKEMH
jgi:hypothetical protein